MMDDHPWSGPPHWAPMKQGSGVRTHGAGPQTAISISHGNLLSGVPMSSPILSAGSLSPIVTEHETETHPPPRRGLVVRRTAANS